jgi:hypothetical protein
MGREVVISSNGGWVIAKVVIPSLRLLSGKMNNKLKKIIEELLREEKI